MREQLIQYVNLLFAGASGCAEVKAEILQNTLDRYDDLVAQGKAPEAAYRLAISGIGDINEILGSTGVQSVPAANRQPEAREPARRTLVRAVAIALYILSPLPLFLIQDEVGLCLLLVIVAVATALLIFSGKGRTVSGSAPDEENDTPRTRLQKSVGAVVWAAGLAIYLILSFATGAWYVTWVIFPIAGSVQGLINACLDLKEANRNEN